MTFKESAHVFEVEGEQCVGILHSADGPVGVLVVVGGPQYRVGSHRQFVQLSRALAQQGIPSFRFDYRGMGDSTGQKQPFDQIDEDIRCAIDTFSSLTGINDFVIWGLCDAASAAWVYAYQDPRVKGLVLMNPWLKNTSAQGKAMLKSYYLQRLLSKAFWRKLLSGGVDLKGSVADASQFAKQAASTPTETATSYQAKMLEGAQQFAGKTCLILSGNDLTAREFEQVAFKDTQWKKALTRNVEVCRIADADHTFSTRAWKARVEEITAAFVKSLYQ